MPLPIPTAFSYVKVMLRLERMGVSPVERQWGEDDKAYLLRTKETFPGVFDDMVVPEKAVFSGPTAPAVTSETLPLF